MISTAYKRLIQVGKISGAISFLVAAPYALIQYWQSRDNARVEQTLALYKLYNAKPFTDYREKITKAVVAHRSQLNESAIDPAKLLAAQLSVVAEDDVEMDLLLLFDFFDGVAVCVASELCDKTTAIKLFQPRALDIYLNFYQYMQSKRSGTNRDYGVGLEEIVKAGTVAADKKKRSVNRRPVSLSP